MYPNKCKLLPEIVACIVIKREYVVCQSVRLLLGLLQHKCKGNLATRFIDAFTVLPAVEFVSSRLQSLHII